MGFNCIITHGTKRGLVENAIQHAAIIAVFAEMDRKRVWYSIEALAFNFF